MIIQKMQCLFPDLLYYFGHVIVKPGTAGGFQHHRDILLSRHILTGHDQTETGGTGRAGLPAEHL